MFYYCFCLVLFLCNHSILSGYICKDVFHHSLFYLIFPVTLKIQSAQAMRIHCLLVIFFSVMLLASPGKITQTREIMSYPRVVKHHHTKNLNSIWFIPTSRTKLSLHLKQKKFPKFEILVFHKFRLAPYRNKHANDIYQCSQQQARCPKRYQF